MIHRMPGETRGWVCCWCDPSFQQHAGGPGPAARTNYGMCARCLEEKLADLEPRGQHPAHPLPLDPQWGQTETAIAQGW